MWEAGTPAEQQVIRTTPNFKYKRQLATRAAQKRSAKA
jgi:hypothetical protein